VITGSWKRITGRDTESGKQEGLAEDRRKSGKEGIRMMQN
jgi:hypothetical protein